LYPGIGELFTRESGALWSAPIGVTSFAASITRLFSLTASFGGSLKESFLELLDLLGLLSNREIFVPTQWTYTRLMCALESLYSLLKFVKPALLSEDQRELLSLIQGSKAADSVVCRFPLLHLWTAACYTEE
jgi:hypothetical protein